MIIGSAIFFITGNPLTNTIWTCQISKSCTDILTLKVNNNATEYDCELNYTVHGTYKIVKDTLFLTLKDDSHTEDNGRTSCYLNKYLFKNNTLRLLPRINLNSKVTENRGRKGLSVIYRRIK